MIKLRWRDSVTFCINMTCFISQSWLTLWRAVKCSELTNSILKRKAKASYLIGAMKTAQNLNNMTEKCIPHSTAFYRRLCTKCPLRIEFNNRGFSKFPIWFWHFYEGEKKETYCTFHDYEWTYHYISWNFFDYLITSQITAITLNVSPGVDKFGLIILYQQSSKSFIVFSITMISFIHFLNV